MEDARGGDEVADVIVEEEIEVVPDVAVDPEGAPSISREDAECPVCREIGYNPVILPCKKHWYCELCWFKLADSPRPECGVCRFSATPENWMCCKLNHPVGVSIREKFPVEWGHREEVVGAYKEAYNKYYVQTAPLVVERETPEINLTFLQRVHLLGWLCFAVVEDVHRRMQFIVEVLMVFSYCGVVGYIVILFTYRFYVRSPTTFPEEFEFVLGYMFLVYLLQQVHSLAMKRIPRFSISKNWTLLYKSARVEPIELNYAGILPVDDEDSRRIPTWSPEYRQSPMYSGSRRATVQ